MMVSFAYPIFAQIRHIVSHLNKKNYANAVAELTELTNIYGDDARLYTLSSLLEDIDLVDKSHQDQLKLQLLNEKISELSNQPNFTSLLCLALEVLGFASLPVSPCTLR
eukprot:TRINITY_DN24262_c0_g2_i1.p1 TRINITY_DN24262_c0_g2~~TRINITY_DN24262_c0_g2_i1.p1  ORF type:complete len:109 (-),score=8.59 TRINITY_DN24262_c0_g2_i1:9-335(-)